MLALAVAFETDAKPRRKSDFTELVQILQRYIDTATRRAAASPARAIPVAAPIAKVRIAQYALWLIAVAVVGFVIFFVYVTVAVVGCPVPPDSFLNFQFHTGGAATAGSVLTAAVLGGSLWLAAGVAAWRLRHKLGVLWAGFVAAYVVGLVVLWNVSPPLIWGPRHC